MSVESPPDPADLARRLGAASDHFRRLSTPTADVIAEWRRYSKRAPWTLKVVRGKRTLYYLTPGDGEFRATLILGERATQAALADPDVPEPMKTALRDARPYAEGRGISVVVRDGADVASVERLLAIKLAPPIRSQSKD